MESEASLSTAGRATTFREANLRRTRALSAAGSVVTAPLYVTEGTVREVKWSGVVLLAGAGSMHGTAWAQKSSRKHDLCVRAGAPTVGDPLPEPHRRKMLTSCAPPRQAVHARL